MIAAVRAGDLILTGGGTGDVAAQIAAILAALRSHGASPADLCLLRAFYRAGVSEDALRSQIADALPENVRTALTLVPVARAGHGELSIEAVAATADTPTRIVAEPDGPACFVAGLQRGRFLLLSAARAWPTGIVTESRDVMTALGQTLTTLGAGFGDVVKMNRWYHADGTKDAWAPSALAVASFYAEPGPIATALSLPVPFPGGQTIQIELMGMLSPDGTPLPKTHSWPEGLWDWPVHLPYKHGLACGGLGFIGGQVSLDEQAQVIDPDHLDRQIARALACIDRVAAGLGPVARPLHLGIYHEIPDDSAPGQAGAAALAALADGPTPNVLAGFANLSYPKMRVEIEAIVEMQPGEV